MLSPARLPLNQYTYIHTAYTLLLSTQLDCLLACSRQLLIADHNMAGIENIVVHSKVRIGRRTC